jgi:hypothetical protein
MKCPKCGSERVERIVEKHIVGSYKVTRCLDCNCDVFYYQQRLDKVLEKFEKDDIGYSYDKCNIWIEYNWDDKKDNKFRLGLFNDVVISLDTVEHLIKDMSDNK